MTSINGHQLISSAANCPPKYSERRQRERCTDSHTQPWGTKCAESDSACGAMSSISILDVILLVLLREFCAMYRVSSSAYDTVQSCYRPMLSCIVVTNPENVRRLQVWNVEHSLTSSCESCAPLFARRGHYQSAMQQLRGKPNNALSSFASSVRSALETDNSRSRISRIPTAV
jgi:hypothetical protein